MGREFRKLVIKYALYTYTSIDFFLRLSIEELSEVIQEIEEVHG